MNLNATDTRCILTKRRNFLQNFQMCQSKNSNIWKFNNASNGRARSLANLLGCYRLNVQITHEIGWKCEIPKTQIKHNKSTVRYHKRQAHFLHAEQWWNVRNRNTLHDSYRIGSMVSLTIWLFVQMMDRVSACLLAHLPQTTGAHAHAHTHHHSAHSKSGPKPFQSSVNESRRHLPNFDYNLLMYTSSSHMISLKKPFIFAV